MVRATRSIHPCPSQVLPQIPECARGNPKDSLYETRLKDEAVCVFLAEDENFANFYLEAILSTARLSVSSYKSKSANVSLFLSAAEKTCTVSGLQTLECTNVSGNFTGLSPNLRMIADEIPLLLRGILETSTIVKVSNEMKSELPIIVDVERLFTSHKEIVGFFHEAYGVQMRACVDTSVLARSSFRTFGQLTRMRRR